MDAHRFVSVLIVAVGAAIALLGVAITTMGVLVRQRAGRTPRPSFDA